MRVLHVFRSYYPDSDGGIERALAHLCAGTSRLGVRNHVFALSPQPASRPIRQGRAVVHQRRRHLELASCSMSMNTMLFFRRLVRHSDVLHYHFPWPFADVLHLLMGRHKPALVTYHSDIVRQRRLERLYRPVMRRFMAQMETVVATSPQYMVGSPVLSTLGHRQMRVIPLGLDERRYPPVRPEEVEQWRQRVGEGFFLFIGVLRYYKGLHILLETLRHNRHRVVIVGSGPMARQLREQADRLGLNDRVTFTGYLPDDDKQALLYLCRALVFPSHQRSEAFGVSLIEAAMASRPMITADIGTGTSYVNRCGETGIVVPPSDAVALGEAMDKLAAAPDVAAQLGAAARQRFESHLDISRSAIAYRDLYAEIIASAAEAAGRRIA
ncbi:glycosyltransferase [Aquisalimonas sp.]|uniref:glycosyltransferase n=1 Tax=Aquisalimonas sp. TaxID=1872621 RepID=UPI0025BB9CDD|nr:glycosyltransferase [Aquisalimonas sp.]